VFTSNFEADLVRIVPRLEHLLKPGGRLAFTFMAPDEALQWRLQCLVEKGAKINLTALSRRAHGARWCILLNEQELYIDTHELPCCVSELQRSCYVFHSAAYVQSLFPHATILPSLSEGATLLRDPKPLVIDVVEAR
jgi:hypothetical protein